ncbi:1-phosphofructokinase [Moraxella macacae 0408225]|uniref:Phosphofructokinase n=1 Tax=Moraxella macacae 0408225 TaxID=1230338 RepID=L2F9G6_9GAMM|nr:1-phosphofructokinase [Moraxella macacae]ELA09709.1 1-phosphofructokinase [Moraxella macacae 0408225]
MNNKKSALCITLNPALDVTLSLDKLHIGAVNRTTQNQTDPAGKGINVACVLSQLGHDVVVTGFLGQGNRQIFDDKFNKLKLDNQFIYVNGDTRQNIKLAEKNGQMTDINSKGFLVDKTAKSELFDRIASLATTCEFVVLSGSLPQGFDLLDFDRLIKLILSLNPKLVIDTSGDALKVATNNSPFMIKPNLAELHDAFGIDVEDLKAEVALFDRLHSDITHIVISKGEDGVNWLQKSKHKILIANAPKVAIKSTVGAGDTMVAGMVHGFLQGYDDKTILQNSVALASHAVTMIGFDVANKKDQERLVSQTTVNEINF